jgi:hypothetical protein
MIGGFMNYKKIKLLAIVTSAIFIYKLGKSIGGLVYFLIND